MEIAIAVVYLAALAGLSAWADARFRAYERLPMQWSFTGAVTWTAPRWLALSLLPLLAFGAFSLAMILEQNGPLQDGQKSGVVPTTLVLGATFLGVHLLHLWLMDKSLDNSGA